MTRTDPGVRFDLGFLGGGPAFSSLYGSQLEPTPADAQSARYTGTFTVPASGAYSFSLTGWGEAQLFLDGEQLVDLATDPADVATESTPTLDLEAGDTHELTIEYRATQAFTGLEPGSLQLGWTHPANALAPDVADAVALARESDVAVVYATTYENEQRDRASLTLPNDQDQLIRSVAAVNPNTVVVLGAAGPVTMPWLGRVDGVVDSYSPGRNRAARSPACCSATSTRRASCRSPSRAARRSPRRSASRTRGTRAGISTSTSTRGSSSATAATTAPSLSPAVRVRPRPVLHVVRVPQPAVEHPGRHGAGAVHLRNTGRRTGAESAQVYVGELPTSVPTPPRQLAGFAKVTLDPGESERVTVTVSRRSLSYFDTGRSAWVTPGGRVPISVGSSSRDIRLTGAVTVAPARRSPVLRRGAITGAGGRCADVAGGASADGTPVQLFDCNGTAAQRWTVSADGTVEALGKCLDVAGGGTANGTPVQLYGCNGTGAQTWRAQSDGTLRNPQSGRCLDTAAGGTGNGARLVIADCTAAVTQRWTLP